MPEDASDPPSGRTSDCAGLTDSQLLSQYVSSRDPAMFEALVRRHGPMVMGVCRRVLRDAHLAEDAFQATFLVLIRKAGSIAKPEQLGNWLYGVASYRALKARTSAGGRRVRERPLVEAQAAPAKEPDRDLYLWFDLQPMLDEELSSLPDEYRAPVVLCDLQGKTIKDAAEQLECPQGTLASRLTKARSMLAERLGRRGVVLSTAILTTLLAQDAASAAVPESSVQSMLTVAASLHTSNRSGVPAWITGMVPAAWTATRANRVRLVASLLFVCGAGAAALTAVTRFRHDPATDLGLPQEKPPAAKQQPVVDRNRPRPKRPPTMWNGPGTFIAAAGEYYLFNNAVTLNTSDEGGRLRWKFAAQNQGPRGNGNFSATHTTDTNMTDPWFLYAEAPDRYWLFNGRGVLLRYNSSFQGPPMRNAVEDNVPPVNPHQPETAIIDGKHQEELAQLETPQPVVERLQRWLRKEPEPSPPLKDGAIVTIGEYRFFNGANTVKVINTDGMITFTVSLPPETGKPHWGPAMALRSDLPWMIYVESPTRVWTYDGWASIVRHTVKVIPPVIEERDGKKIASPASISIDSPVASLPSLKPELLTWKPPPTVLAWLPLAKNGQPPPQKSNLPDLSLKDRPSNGFINQQGEYSLFTATLTLQVSVANDVVRWRAAWPPRKGASTTVTESEEFKRTIEKNANWFLYAETVDKIWWFDGVKKIELLHRDLSNELAPTTSNVQADLPTWNSKDYGELPDKVRQRLPAGVRPKRKN